MWVCMYIWLRKCSHGNTTPRKNMNFSIVGLIMILQCCFAMWAYMKVISQGPTGKLLLSCCRNWGGCVWVHRPLGLFFCCHSFFSMQLATSVLPRVGLNLCIIHMSLFQANFMVYYMSMGVSRRKWVCLFIHELWEELSVSCVWWQCVKC